MELEIKDVKSLLDCFKRACVNGKSKFCFRGRVFVVFDEDFRKKNGGVL